MTVGINRWTGIGNMVADPEVKPAGESKVTRFRMAVNETSNDENTLFLDVNVWDKEGERVAEWGRKGRLVYVEGSIRQRTWEDSETQQKRTAWAIRAWSVRFLDKAPEGAEKPKSKDDEFAW